jgi:DNA-binding response OmpR family regulator
MPTAKTLIVDDEQAVRNSLQEILELEDYPTDSAATGEEALELIENGRYELVILDLKLPGVPGVEVMHQIHQRAPETKVIILTGYASLETAVAALRAGAEDYIQKPYDVAEILDSVGQAFSKKALRKRKVLIIEQMDSTLEQLKDLEGLKTPDRPSRRVIALPQGIMVDLERRELWRGGQRAELTPTEGKLLAIFLENKGRVLTHEELVFLVQGYEAQEQEAAEILRPMVSRLRKKLSQFPGMEGWIQSVRGTGYLWEPEN